MALLPPAEDSSSKIVIATPGDREKAFRKARRHSIFVRTLRAALPVAALVLMASYGVFMQRTIHVKANGIIGEITVGPLVPEFDDRTMSNPRFNGFNRKDGSSYSLTAKKAVTDLSPTKPIGLVGITGVVKQADGNEITVEAAEGKYLRKTARLELFNGIRIETTSGLHARLARAIVLPNEGLVTSEVPVEMWMKAGQVRANTMVLKHKLNEVTFGKGVAVRLNPSQQRRRKATKQPVSVPTLDLAGNSDAPVDIASTTMIVKDRQRSILLAGEVRVTQGPSTLTSRELEILYQPTSAKPASAKGAGQPTAQPQTNAPLAGSGDIRSARASGDVTITREGSRVIATVAHFLNLEKRVVLVGDVVVTSGTDRRILAERAEIQTETNDAVLTGRNVTLTQGKNVLRGSQATVKHATARMQLVRPGGRIAAVLAPQQKQQKKNKRRANRATKRGAAAGRALTGLAGGWTFTSDPNAPIEIGAVSLDVDDKARTAVFRGKVVARQGGVVIQTASLTASYLGGGSLLPGTSAVKQKNPLGAATKPAQEARVTHVRAANGVIITSESGQLVQGDWADFNVAANTITIGGNVRMQKGRQVVTGPKIVIDLNTGLSRVVRTNETVAIDTRKKQAAAPPAGAATRCREGRSCLVFFPGDAKASHKKTTRIPTPKPAIRPLPTAPLPATVGNSWSTISTPSN